jgi:hypothetical protein
VLAKTQRFTSPNGATVLVAVEDGRWHLSISHPDRDPTWEEIRSARYALLPDEAQMALILPPKAEYVNAHEHCFHLWEIKERW